jgi:anti-anti-sigma factor
MGVGGEGVDESLGPTGLRCRYSADPDGVLRMTLLGELDMAVAEELSVRMRELRDSAPRVRLDLSQLRFIDLGGLDAILTALAEARRAGWPLEVDPHISPSVERLIQYVGAGRTLWPERHRGGGARSQRSDRSEPRAFRRASSSWRLNP